jgi:transposase-like protein
VRLKEKWTTEHEEWSQRSLVDRHHVYIWADGIHVNVRLGDEEHRRQCILVLMGATPDGRKELIAVQDGYRESVRRLILTDRNQRRLSRINWPSVTA